MVKFLLKFPKETMELLLSDINVKDAQWNRFMIYLLKHKNGLSFRNAIQEKGPRLIQLILINSEGSIAISQG